MSENFKESVETHWKYIEELLRTHEESETTIQRIGFHYKTAMLHGYKHGYKDAREEFEG